jgi:hypothetical protein
MKFISGLRRVIPAVVFIPLLLGQPMAIAWEPTKLVALTKWPV